MPSAVSLPPPPPQSASAPWVLRVDAARERLINAVPPRWVEVARRYPVLWMVVAPVLLASLLIVVLFALQPAPHPAAALPALAVNAGAAAPTVEAAPVAPPAAAEDKPASSALANLEGKAPETLNVEEVLLLSASRAQHKRDDAKALSRQLQEKPDLANDSSVQTQLLRFAADPDTAAVALAAMAHARSPVGPDLLYEAWTSRSTPPGSAELARSLLFSHDVRSSASPALAVALALRSAESCEVVLAALPQAESDGDSRALVPLAKLNGRRGCGAKKTADCYACLRSRPKQVFGTIDAVKRRRAPSYPTR